jgi:hypothetical protein
MKEGFIACLRLDGRGIFGEAGRAAVARRFSCARLEPAARKCLSFVKTPAVRALTIGNIFPNGKIACGDF